MKKLLLSSLLLANGVAIAAPFVVKDIRVDGVQPATGEAIISSLPVKVGQTATDADVSNVVRQLFSLNRFQNVQATREGNTLVIKVAERAILNSVDLDGNGAIPKDALEQNLKANLIAKGEVYDAEKVVIKLLLILKPPKQKTVASILNSNSTKEMLLTLSTLISKATKHLAQKN